MKQIENALHHFDNEIAILDDLLLQLREAEAILHLVKDEEEKKFSDRDDGRIPWKICVYFNH